MYSEWLIVKNEKFQTQFSNENMTEVQFLSAMWLFKLKMIYYTN